MKFFDSTQKAYRQQRSTFRNIRTFPRNIKTYCFWPKNRFILYPIRNSYLWMAIGWPLSV